MSSTQYSVYFNNIMDAASGVTTPGQVLCFNSAGTALVLATTGNLGGQRPSGVCVFLTTQGKAVQVQSDGFCPRGITQIPYDAGNEASPIRINAGAYLERADPIISGDIIVGTCNQWGDANLAFGQQSSALIGTLAGDVTGDPSANTVVAIQNIPVSTTDPTANQVLAFSSGAWRPTAATSAVTLAGDVTGASGANTVAAIQGILVSTTDPTTGQIMAYSGTQWAPAAATSSVTLAGDVTGASGANVAERVHGATVPISGSLTTGNSLHVSGVSALSYSALNLAGGSGWVTGILPVGNLPAMGGDVTGTVAANLITTITGSGPNNVTMTSGVSLVYATGTVTGASGVYGWTGSNGFRSAHTTNQHALIGGLSATVAGIAFGSAADTPSTSTAQIQWASGSITFTEATLNLVASSKVAVNSPLVGFNINVTPVITQDATPGTPHLFTVRAQNSATATDGGNLLLSGGTSSGGQDGYVTIHAGTGGFKVDTSFIQFAAITTPTITQAGTSGASADFLIKGQSTTGVFGAGAPVIVEGGEPGADGSNGAVRLNTGGAFTVVEAQHLFGGAAPRYILSLLRGVPITTTQMPAGTGDVVVYLANCTTAPTADSVSGGILYVESGALTYRGPSGMTTAIGPA